MGGAGVTLFLNHDHSFFCKMGCGPSTNTRAELLALWALLHSAASMGIPKLLVRGDFVVIINWINPKASLTALNLEHWCN